MSKTFTTKRLAFAVAALAAAASPLVATGGSVSADPKQFDGPFIGVGSDTTQDLFNAFAGFSNGINYVPLQTSSVNGSKQIVSWDATANGLTTTCIATKTGGPSFNRPNGSGSGRAALLSSFTSGGTTSKTNCGTGTVSASGQISFARSSSLSGTGGTTMAYVPFARDALSYGAYRANGSPILDLSTAELGQIFTTPAGVDIVRGANTTRVIGCGIQPGSGTGTSWQNLVTGSSATYQTTVCDAYIDPATTLAVGRSQENDGDALVIRGNVADSITDGAQVVIGFSVGGYISKANNVAPGGMPSTVVLGANPSLAGGASPVAGSAPNYTANATYYASSFGRDLYNVFQASVINSAFGNDPIKEMFKGASSKVCLAVNTIEAHGFLVLATCGDSTTTIRGA
jgi:hypothetical protein